MAIEKDTFIEDEISEFETERVTLEDNTDSDDFTARLRIAEIDGNVDVLRAFEIGEERYRDFLATAESDKNVALKNFKSATGDDFDIDDIDEEIKFYDVNTKDIIMDLFYAHGVDSSADTLKKLSVNH